MAFWRARLDYKTNFDFTAMALFVALGVLCWAPVRFFLFQSVTSNENLLRYLPSLFLGFWGLAVMVREGRWKQSLPLVAVAVLLALLFTFLPPDPRSQTRQLANLHSFVLLWCLLPLLLGDGLRSIERTGEVLCWSGLFLLGGVLLTLVTLGLFSSLGLDVTNFYVNNVVSLGLVMAPFVALSFAGHAEIRVSGILAKVFAPLAAATLLAFLVALLISYPRLFEEREAFFVYCLVPVVVMAIAFFVTSTEQPSPWVLKLTVLLSGLSLLIVLLVLPAALARVFQGVTPNRLALLGLELLLLANTGVLLWNQIGVLLKRKPPEAVAASIAGFLPVYLGWSSFVVFVFPLLFWFR